jgi:ribonucleoside-diphosphate reductase alpha chain
VRLQESKLKPGSSPCEGKRGRPKVLHGHTLKMVTGCGALYVTVNALDKEFFELFARGGKAGGCASSQCEAIGRLISLAWRNGIKTQEIVMQLKGICCHRPGMTGDDEVTSCADAMGKAIEIAERLWESEATKPKVETGKASRNGA